MRVVLTNFGSTGSVFPYVALGIQFRQQGHRPLLALPPYFADWVKSFGLDFAPVGPDLREMQNRINEAMVTTPDSAEQLTDLLAPLANAVPQMYRELRAACVSADVLVSGPVQPAGLMVHETTGIPLVTIQNVHFTNGGTPAFQRALAGLLNPFRRELGLSALYDPIMQANCADLVLFAMSRHVRPPQPNWPPHYHMVGYFFMEESWQPPSEIADFFASGERPIVVTFGSMTHDDPSAFTDLILEAILQAGCRAVIQHGWSGLARNRLPDTVLSVGFVPHSWLFEHAALVIHHGGSGTTAAVFRAGVPSIFVPHTWEQPVWADLGRELGCAGDAIPFTELSAERLGKAISETLRTDSYHTAAAKLGEKIRDENGVHKAQLLIEKLVENIGLGEEGLSSHLRHTTI